MSFSEITRRPVTRRRLGGLAAIALVAALAAALIVSTRADAQATTTSLSVSPPNAVNQFGTAHTMGVTVSPVQSGVQVRYRILSGPNTGDTGALDTNATGLVIFSYNGDGGVGSDTILIWADLDRDGVRDDNEPTTAATADWVSVGGIGIALSPASSSGAVGASHSSTATLTPAQNGTVVRFQVVSGPNVGRSTIQVTNTAGNATFTYVGTGGLGTDAIIAWADLDGDGFRDGNEPQATSTRLWITAGIGGVTIDPATSQKPVGQQHTIRAAFAPAQSGLYMRFEVTSGPNAGKRGLALTDGGGRGTYTYLGSSREGVDVIVAWVDLDKNGLLDSNEPRGQATASWGTAATARTIVASPQTGTSLIGTSYSVAGTVSPAQAGLVVRFRITAGPHAGSNGRVLSNAAGQATYSYVGTKTGTDSITTWVDQDDDGAMDTGEPRAFASKVWTTTAPARSIALAPTANVALLGTIHTVTATASPAQSGTIVRFLVSMGPNYGDSGFGVTNSQGKATFSYLGNGGVGTDAIVSWLDLNNNGSRETNEPQVSAVQRWVSTQVSGISVSPTGSNGGVNTPFTVTATVSPASINSLVRFRITQGPNLGDQGSAFTNASGQASFTYVGDGGIGADLVLVWADADGDNVLDANEPQTAAIRGWTAVAASAFSLTPASATNPVNTRHSMTATVTPAQSGLVVRFEVSAGPNQGTRGSDDTNSGGRADLSYVGSGGPGTDVILAWVDFDRDGQFDAGEPQAVATKQWTAAAANALTISPGSDTNQVNTRHSMTATVAPVQRDLLVRFEVSAGPNQGTRGSNGTNSSGRADLSYVGSGGVGTDVILGWVDFDRDGRIDAGEPQTVITKQWTPVSVSALTLTPASAQAQVSKKHKVTAQLSPVLKGVLIRFEVISGPNAGDTERDRTGGNGRATASFRGDGGSGTDVIRAWADVDADGVLDAGEPQATALVEWRGSTTIDARVKEVCDNLKRYQHPSLPTLCRLIHSGQLSQQSTVVISNTILEKANLGSSPQRSRGDHDDDDRDDDDDHDHDDDD